jgi:glycosyltransferase involved in cell wall biosynthesis
MKILLHTRFHPNVGGIETVASLLAHEWLNDDQEVVICTDIECPAEKKIKFPFEVYHRPRVAQWLHLMRWADVFVHMNVSLKAFWPHLCIRKPFVAVHHAGYFVSRRNDRDWKERLKLRCARKAEGNIAVSAYVESAIGIPCEIVPNPFGVGLFRTMNQTPQERELAFVGRLVSDKGCDLLIQALGKLRETGFTPQLSIIGDGPERPALKRLVATLQLQDHVTFVGSQTQDSVARLLQRHEVLVVPSLWEEPFGVVALEGAACGCIILGSDGGGLPEAIGPCGITFRRGDVGDLAAKLAHLFAQREEWQLYKTAAPEHLELHRPDLVAKRYLEVFERARQKFQGQSVEPAGRQS